MAMKQSLWLRLDVDNPCYYGYRVGIRLRFPWISSMLIPGYFEDTKETLAYLRANWSQLHRVWFIRHIVLPPKGLLDDEEIGLHVTEPHNILNEYRKVSKRFKRPLLKFTRHGENDAHLQSGREWTKQDFEYVRECFPNMRDMTDGEHFTVHRDPLTALDVLHHSTNLLELDHVLFHPVHFRVARNDLETLLQQLQTLGKI